MSRPVKLTRHKDHDPGLICRPAFGYGLCEVLGPQDDSTSHGEETVAR